MARRRGEAIIGHVERQILAAQERGEFDGLAGTGRPIPDLHRPHDENWWIRRKLREEQFTAVPPALRLRMEVEAMREQLLAVRDEREVRRLVAQVNERIRHANATIVSGPPSTVWPLDVEREVARWRAARGPDDVTPAVDDGPVAVPRRRWWERFRRR